ncbi:hypothetical protein Tco_1100922 [Tanacetum coccineum]
MVVREGCGGEDGVEVVCGVEMKWMFAIVEGGGGETARDGEWYGGSDRSVGEKHHWSRSENSPENFSGDGRRWPESVWAAVPEEVVGESE